MIHHKHPAHHLGTFSRFANIPFSHYVRMIEQYLVEYKKPPIVKPRIRDFYNKKLFMDREIIPKQSLPGKF